MTKKISGREKRAIRVTIFLSALFLLALALLRNSYAGGNHITTATLSYATVYDSAVAEGIVIRADSVIKDQKNGYTMMLVEDSEKVAKSDRLAVSFSSEAGLLNYNTSVSLQEKADLWQQMLNQDAAMLNLTTVNASLYDNLLSLGQDASEGKVNSEHNTSLMKNAITRSHILGTDAGIQSRVNQMQSDAATSLRSAGTPSYITSPSAGYFSYMVDGLESELTMSNAEQLTADRVEEYISSRQENGASGCLGRVVSGYQWYYAALTDGSREEELRLKSSYQLRFSSFSVKGVLTKTEKTEDGQLYCLFLISEHIEKAVSERQLDGEIIFDSDSGYQVPKSCVRLETDEEGNKVQGVYVIRGQRCVFMQIDILLEKENYYIVRADLQDNSGLYLNDTLVLSGRNLYDGMVIN